MISGFVVCIVYGLLCAIVLRIDQRNPAGVTVGLALVTYLLGFAAALISPLNFWVYSISYWFPALCFLMLFGAVLKSVSLRMLLDLQDRPSQRSTRADIYTNYIVDDSYKDRIGLIVEKGFAVATPSGLQLTEKGQNIVAITRALQRLFAIERSG